MLDFMNPSSRGAFKEVCLTRCIEPTSVAWELIWSFFPNYDSEPTPQTRERVPFLFQVDVYGFRSTSMVFFALYLVMAAVDGAELAASAVRRRRSK